MCPGAERSFFRITIPNGTFLRRLVDVIVGRFRREWAAPGHVQSVRHSAEKERPQRLASLCYCKLPFFHCSTSCVQCLHTGSRCPILLPTLPQCFPFLQEPFAPQTIFFWRSGSSPSLCLKPGAAAIGRHPQFIFAPDWRQDSRSGESGGRERPIMDKFKFPNGWISTRGDSDMTVKVFLHSRPSLRHGPFIVSLARAAPV